MEEAQEATGENPSPFHGDTQWAWDATSLSAFKKCPRYYKYSILDGWQGSGAIHLFWGNELHKALEGYYRYRTMEIDHDTALHNTLRDLHSRVWNWHPTPRTKSEELKTKDHLFRSIIWYLDHYDPDPAQTVVLKSGAPAVELNFCFSLGFGPGEVGDGPGKEPWGFTPEFEYHLCGYLDRVVDFNGDLFVMDHKTSSGTLGSYYFEKYDLDEQMTLYTLAAQVILHSPIKGVIIDGIQVAVGFTRPVRAFTFRTPDQLEEWMDQLRTWLEWARHCAMSDNWPMNFNSCDKYGGCEFKTICSKSPHVRERFLEANFERREERWNPLKPR